MLGLISPTTAWFIVLLIAFVTVLTCLRAIAMALGREIAKHDLKIEAQKRRTAEAANARGVKPDEIITV